MEIIIGRDPATSRLHCIAAGREYTIGQPGTVPASVSQRHCRLTISGDRITISNIRERDVTYVDGNQILVKSISADSRVQLGIDRYAIPLQQIIQLAGERIDGRQPQQEQQTFSLRPLQSVWEDYSTRMIQIDLDMARKQKAEKKKRGIQALCSSVGLLFVFIEGLGYVRFVLVFISVCIAAYLLLVTDDDDISSVKKKNLNEEFSLKYKCPNPACGKPFGYRSYKEIEYTRQCNACGCRYSH